MNYNSKIINKEIVLIIDIVWVCDVAGFRSRALSHETKRCNLKLPKINQSPGHSANMLLAAVLFTPIRFRPRVYSFLFNIMYPIKH